MPKTDFLKFTLVHIGTISIRDMPFVTLLDVRKVRYIMARLNSNKFENFQFQV